MPKPAPQKEQVKRHREHLRTRESSTATRTTDQILQAAKITQAERAGVRGSLGSKAGNKPKSGR